jgi:hypothetical protein
VRSFGRLFSAFGTPADSLLSLASVADIATGKLRQQLASEDVLVIVAADVRIYRNIRYASCGRRGHAVKPMHKGREYRQLCRCRNRRCSAGSEG